jgi:ketol-acid reductoisomerase
VKAADVVMILLPDENIPEVYKNNVEPNIKQGAAGLRPRLQRALQPGRARADLDVIMVAPKGPGHTVRSEYLKGGGVPP